MGNCKECKHYNGGHGDIDCEFCDPPFENRFEPKEGEHMKEIMNEAKESTEIIIEYLKKANASLSRMADTLKEAADAINASNERIMKLKEDWKVIG